MQVEYVAKIYIIFFTFHLLLRGTRLLDVTYAMNAVATLNDQFRKSWQDVVFTPGVMTGIEHHLGLAHMVESFSSFSEDNDPYGERDFGSLVYEGKKVLWKIDYYDHKF